MIIKYTINIFVLNKLYVIVIISCIFTNIYYYAIFHIHVFEFISFDTMNNYYCLIRLFNNTIVLNLIKINNYDIDTKKTFPICFSASSASILYRLIALHKEFYSLPLSHILYISQELYKAEMTIFFNQQYIQS